MEMEIIHESTDRVFPYLKKLKKTILIFAHFGPEETTAG
jgi:hypothetical protein